MNFFMLKTFDFEKMPIVEIVNEILVDSSKRGASDIHFDPQENFMKVRIRIDGELHDYCEVPLLSGHPDSPAPAPAAPPAASRPSGPAMPPPARDPADRDPGREPPSRRLPAPAYRRSAGK